MQRSTRILQDAHLKWLVTTLPSTRNPTLTTPRPARERGKAALIRSSPLSVFCRSLLFRGHLANEHEAWLIIASRCFV